MAANAIAAAALWLLAFAAFAWPRHTLGTHTDLFQFFNWINALDHGQMPNRDFATPMGALAHYLPYWGYRLTGQFGGALEVASLLALGIVLPCAVVALARRVVVAHGLAVLVGAAALIVVPWNPGDGGMVVSQFLFYNRWCWAALAMLLVFYLPARTRARSVVDGVAIAVLLLFLFFTKMSYFAVGAAFVCVFGLALGRFAPAAWAGSGIAVAAMLCTQVGTGAVGDYLTDVWVALRATGVLWTGKGSPFLLNVQASWAGYAAFGIAAAIATLGAGRKPTRAGNRQALDWTFFLFCFFCVASSVLILAQNGAQACVFGLAAAFLHIATHCRGWRRALASGALAVFLLPTLLAQSVATFAFVTKHRYTPAALPRMENVYYNPSAGRDLRHLRSGVALLQRNSVASGALTALDFANWFPVFFDIAPVPGRLWCFHPGRSISRATAPPAAALFANTRQVMVPKFDATAQPRLRAPRDFLLALYGDYLARAYVLLDENDGWRLLAKEPADGDGPGADIRARR